MKAFPLSAEEGTRQGLRFYLFDGNWDEFKRLIDRVDKAYQEIA